MNIQIDTREKARAIKLILTDFDKNNVKYFSSKLFVGDYMSLDNPRLSIDRKQSLLELCSNVCQQHERFTSELKRAQDNGIKIIILCEHGGNISTLNDVIQWKNPRLKTSPKAVSGQQLFKILYSISKKYDVDFIFCQKNQTGTKIIELLSGGTNNA